MVSDGFRANLIGRGVPADKVHTIRNGVCPGEFDPDAAPDTQLRAWLGALTRPPVSPRRVAGLRGQIRRPGPARSGQ